MSLPIPDDRIGDLLARWEEMREQGRDIPAETLCADCPELAAELERRIRALLAMDRLLGSAKGPPDGGGRRGNVARSSARCVVDYGALRFLAEGGLGEVFAAEGGDLHREVALKFIRAAQARDPESRRRFLFEAEVTGRLEHPGVVPVYGLGTDDHGHPCYAMRLIRGQTLQDAIQAFHAAGGSGRDDEGRGRDLRGLLRRFISVCNTVAYAHSRGVIHRDLKPKNVMIGPFDETLVVDWGLARSIDHGGPEVAGEDRLLPILGAGEVSLTLGPVGTLGYMSPEQARDEPPGPASDVYSLGATLYCLLCGKPPFEGEDVGAILDAVREGRFPRPSRLDPSLEAVCLKAMALEPRERYASPRLLAEDIERWLADEPVSAWREPRSRRLARWVARHRTAVAGAAAAVLAGVVGLVAVLVVQSDANARLSRSLGREMEANRALNAANAKLEGSKAAVQARYDLAVEAIKALHTGASEDFLLKEDRFKEFRDWLLTSASNFYVKLGDLLSKEGDPASRRALAASNFELARLTDMIGRKEDALAVHKAVLAARVALAAEPGADIGTSVDVGRSLTEVALLLDATGKTDEALDAYQQSESMLADLAHSGPEARAALAACRTRKAFFLAYTGEFDQALAAFTLARADQEALASASGAPNDARRELAETINRIGTMLWYTGRLREAENEYGTALSIQQRLVDDNPTVTLFRSSLAATYCDLGHPLQLNGKLAEAEAAFLTALAIQRRLADDNPMVAAFRRDLGITRYAMGVLLSAIGKPSEAETMCRMAIAIQQRMADENSADAHSRMRLGLSHQHLSLLRLQAGQPREAEAACRTAVAIQQKLVDEHPDVVVFRDMLVYALIDLGDAVRASGRTAEAEDVYERAVSLEEPRVEQNPTDTQQRYYLVRATRRRGLALTDLGDLAAAAADARRALKLCDGLPPRSIWDFFETACCHAALAGLAGRAGSGVSAIEGEAETARAMEWLGSAVAVGYRNANELRIERALDPLRSRDDFRLLMMDVVFPAEPFARADDRPGSQDADQPVR